MKTLTLLAALLLLPLAPNAAQAQQPAHSLNGHPAPRFQLKGLNGQPVSLAAYKGKVVLLNFWASWCAPCQAEMPTFEQWQRSYGPAKFQVIGVSMDDGAAQAAAAVKKLHVTYPVAVGNAHLGNLYGGIDGLPVTFLIDRQGRIRAEYAGGNDQKAIHAEIDHLLAR
ncbi:MULTISPECIES: TlpA disulfide reductase family protein [Acidobacterium]|uniref:Putative thiol-disulfide interchange protein n=1 Tax=Acidobacterium capsulatum (strain ATCC 51196 / DSM 11244 / BCRC 80197 / JCM 7670 / NBRC 15755 / NCIMB 13165 / 161) TaxID=240015 RepID=C1F0Y5_ACIC5|nr:MULTISPECIES: TlpA disulfide reductase family protein [Acidobacterium]ACO31329.1 putative thiol-disulfide interchange protein [Acidobacterium capsulatum ATCC 51196]